MRDLTLDRLGGNNWSVDTFTYNFPLISIEDAMQISTLQLIIKTNNIVPLSSDTAIWGSRTLYGATPGLNATIVNNSDYNMLFFIDVSSGGISRTFGVRYNSYSYISDMYTPSTAYRPIFIPSFSSINITQYTNNITIDAIYIDLLPPTDYYSSYINDITSEAFGDGRAIGFGEGFESKDNLEWLEDVATAVKDIFSVEIFPGMTVGFLVLFPLVIAIVKWFLSLFGIGGGS
jgi:hypothetical protein